MSHVRVGARDGAGGALSPVVTITGGSGFLGQLLRVGLQREGWEVRVFDPYRGPLVNLVRRRWLAGDERRGARRAARAIRRAQLRAEPALIRTRAIRRRADDILGERSSITAAFAGSDAVIHLAGIPHPHQPGATDADFLRVNYDGSVNVLEAARAAGVPTFVFASSAQVYGINHLARVDELPLPEDAHLPLPAEGQTTYGFLKGAFERYLAGVCADGSITGVALRLEYPGFRSMGPENLYVSTSIENTVAGFACALRPPAGLRFGAFNLADAHVDPEIADVQAYIARRWPYARNRVAGNGSLMSTERAQQVLGYRPVSGGRYVDASLVW